MRVRRNGTREKLAMEVGREVTRFTHGDVDDIDFFLVIVSVK